MGRTDKANPEKRVRREAPKRTNEHYSDEQKIRAVAAARAANPEHMLGKAALEEARRAVGYPIGQSTFVAWIKRYKDVVVAAEAPKPSILETVQDQQASVIAQYAKVRELALQEAQRPEKIAAAPFEKLMLGAGIADTKIAEFAGLSPEERETTLELKRECQLDGRPLTEVQRELSAYLRLKRKQAPVVVNIPPGES